MNRGRKNRGKCDNCLDKTSRNKITTKHGYVFVHVIGDHHRKAKKSDYVLEHVLIMEGALGREIKYPEETIHHKNGIKHDNRIENLELWVSKHKPGQRVTDLRDWCVWFLEQYDADASKLEEIYEREGRK